MISVDIFLDRRAEVALAQDVIHLRVPRAVRTVLEAAKVIRPIRRVDRDDAVDYSLGSGVELVRVSPLMLARHYSFEDVVIIITVDDLRGDRDVVEICREDIARRLREQISFLRRRGVRFSLSLRGAHNLSVAA